MTGAPVEPTRRPGERKAENVQRVVECLLSQFNHISVERVHKLLFLIEYEYFEKNATRLTDATFEPYLDGVFSKEIEEAINEIDGVERKDVRIGRNRVDTLSVPNRINCNLEDELSERIRVGAMKYGEEPPKVVNKKISNVPIYQQATIGEEIEFKKEILEEY